MASETTETTDVEKGLTTATTTSAPPSTSEQAASPKPRVNTPLYQFQILVGIKTPHGAKKNSSGFAAKVKATVEQARKPKTGLYERAREQERSSSRAYTYTSYFSHTLYMIQIFLAATFTALSSYKGTHPVTLTVLGAINTVLAGCLAWQKGQGWPHRYRKARDEFRALLLAIEMTERKFMNLEHGGHTENGKKLDPQTEMNKIEKLFNDARANQQANLPDLYVTTTAHSAKS